MPPLGSFLVTLFFFFLFQCFIAHADLRDSTPCQTLWPLFLLCLGHRFNLWYRPIFGAGRLTLFVLLLTAISYESVDMVVHIFWLTFPTIKQPFFGMSATASFDAWLSFVSTITQEKSVELSRSQEVPFFLA